jgi:D-alanyl-D-alanine carboxypeptidase
MGASSSSARAIKAAQLLERGFTSNPLSWLTPSLGSVESLTPVNAAPPNLREEMCGAHRKRKATEDEDDSAAVSSFSSDSAYSVFLSSLRTPNSKANLLQDLKMGEPVLVHTGPPKAKQPETRTADTKAGNTKGGNTKNAKKSGPAVAGAATAPWSSLSPASITNNPPPDLATTQDQGSATPASPEQPKSKAAPKAKAKTAVATQKNATAKKAAPDSKDKDAKKK